MAEEAIDTGMTMPMKVPRDASAPSIDAIQQWLEESDTAERITWRAIERWGIAYGAGLPSHAYMDIALVFINPYRDSDFSADLVKIREESSGHEIEVKTMEAMIRLLERNGKWFRRDSERVPEGKEFAYGLG